MVCVCVCVFGEGGVLMSVGWLLFLDWLAGRGVILPPVPGGLPPEPSVPLTRHPIHSTPVVLSCPVWSPRWHGERDLSDASVLLCPVFPLPACPRAPCLGLGLGSHLWGGLVVCLASVNMYVRVTSLGSLSRRRLQFPSPDTRHPSLPPT